MNLIIFCFVFLCIYLCFTMSKNAYLFVHIMRPVIFFRHETLISRLHWIWILNSPFSLSREAFVWVEWSVCGIKKKRSNWDYSIKKCNKWLFILAWAGKCESNNSLRNEGKANWWYFSHCTLRCAFVCWGMPCWKIWKPNGADGI